MATQKELLEELGNEIGELSRTVSEDFITSREEVTSAIESSLERHGQAQQQAAEVISKSIDNAAGAILGGVVVGGLFWLFGKGIGALIDKGSSLGMTINTEIISCYPK
jgi:hypothetical protein